MTISSGFAARLLVPLASLVVLLTMAACAKQSEEPLENAVLEEREPALKDVFSASFLVGTALNEWQVTGRAPIEADIAARHFNAVTAENAMKWERIHPEPGRYDFEIADQIVEFGETHGMTVIGHTLVWHSQTPSWVFEDGAGNPVSRDTLLARMRDHIHTVVGRYRGRVAGWDVVNEVIDEDGSLRDSPWRRIIGDDYIAKAFEYAYEADPEAGRYYNDFNIVNEAKRDGAAAMLAGLVEQGVPITGVGIQGHYQLFWPTYEQISTAIELFAGFGLDVMITELDMNVLPGSAGGAEITDTAAWRAEIDPYKDGLPPEVADEQARKYAEFFRAFLDHKDLVSRVTFWGVSDASSWKNNWPVPGRTNYTLLFDRDGNPKPAFYAVVEMANR